MHQHRRHTTIERHTQLFTDQSMATPILVRVNVQHNPRKKSDACSQGDERLKQTPQRELRTRTLCLKYLDLFKALLGHSLWVGS